MNHTKNQINTFVAAPGFRVKSLCGSSSLTNINVGANAPVLPKKCKRSTSVTKSTARRIVPMEAKSITCPKEQAVETPYYQRQDTLPVKDYQNACIFSDRPVSANRMTINVSIPSVCTDGVSHSNAKAPFTSESLDLEMNRRETSARSSGEVNTLREENEKEVQKERHGFQKRTMESGTVISRVSTGTCTSLDHITDTSVSSESREIETPKRSNRTSVVPKVLTKVEILQNTSPYAQQRHKVPRKILKRSGNNANVGRPARLRRSKPSKQPSEETPHNKIVCRGNKTDSKLGDAKHVLDSVRKVRQTLRRMVTENRSPSLGPHVEVIVPLGLLGDSLAIVECYERLLFHAHEKDSPKKRVQFTDACVPNMSKSL